MASQADPQNSVIIRMKRKRQAPPLESFFIESDNSDRKFVEPKTVFIRTTSIDMITPTEDKISEFLGGNDLGGKMKKLKLGDIEHSNAEINNNSLQVFDIVQDSVTDTFTLQPYSQPKTAPNPKPVVTCNGDELIREILPNSNQNIQPIDYDYVYDLYLTDGADLSMFDDPTMVLINPLEYDVTWVDPVTKAPHAHYFDEFEHTGLSDDDSNEETNWRNDYPEIPDSDLEQEIDREYSSKYIPEQEDYYTGDFDEYRSNQAALYNDPWAGDLSAQYLEDEKDLYYNDGDISN
ncbi:hypothetical protein LOD99_4638 [Oopsacas minuta]|uniref:Probable RNA polymerase II nuclear localization protein SLC7A6OS n=1 Tax=Oopsacas minuta TaxID=111878 RepID=A0AAV7JSZ5_9METZ|nr:hypothetical protein LOD99_4638 [Oopsacas minuta]